MAARPGHRPKEVRSGDLGVAKHPQATDLYQTYIFALLLTVFHIGKAIASQ